MIYLRQSTASQEIPLGYFLDSTDGNTEETGLTIANTDIKLWKNGATTLANKNSGGATHISNGIYYAVLDDTDTNTLGSMIIFVHVSGALTVRLECIVLPANIYDSWIAGSDYQQVDTVEVSGTSQTANDNGADINEILTDTNSLNDTKIAQTLNLTASGNIGIDWANVENTGSTVDLSDTAIDLCDEVTSNTDMRGTNGANTTAPDNASIATILSRIIGTLAAGTHNAQSGDGYAVVSNVTYGLSALKTLIDAITGYVDSLESRLTADRAGYLDELAAGNIPSDIDDIKAVTDTITDLDTLVDAVWDEILTAGTHNIATSAGRRMRELAGNIIRSETAQGPGTGNNQIQLDSGASAVNGAYDPSLIYIVNGTGIGQSRLVLQYNGTTKTCTVDRDWKVNPDDTSEYILSAHPGREHVNEGLAQGGDTNKITLNTLASSDDNSYIGQLVFIRSGTGADQVGLVSAYNGTTKVATIEEDWDIVPDTTSGYVMLPQKQLSKANIYAQAIAALTAYAPNKTVPDAAGTAAGLIGDLNNVSTAQITAAILAMVVEGTLTFQQVQRIKLAALVGKTTDNGTKFRDIADSKDRIDVTLDESYNRTSIILDGE